MTRPRRTAVVVGGGIAGLSAARSLVAAGVAVTVLESSPRWGGKLASVVIDGVRLDAGAESVLARRPEALALIADLGLQHQLVHPGPATSRVLVRGRAVGLPPSAMGVPRDLAALRGYLSDDGLRRADREPTLPAPPLDGDVGIGAYVDQRFGPEVTDTLLEPLLGGVYAGRSRQLSFAAVAPALFARARHGGSLLEHARQVTATTAAGPVFAGLTGGITTLVDALVADLRRRGARLLTGVTVRELLPRDGGGHRLVCGPVPAPELYEADAVVLAAPAAATGRLLSRLGGPAAELAAVPYASTAVLTLVLRGARLDGSGLLVPPAELATVKALTHSSTKWDWVGEQADQVWGPDAAVIRASVGRLGEERLLQLDDDALLARTWAEARVLPGWERAELIAGRVTRWGGALPQYLVGHPQLVARLQAAVATQPGLAVCGAALSGVGVAACLASAEAAAQSILHQLGASSATSEDLSDPRTTIGRPLVERN